MQSKKMLPWIFGSLLVLLLAIGGFYQMNRNGSETPTVTGEPSDPAVPAPTDSPSPLASGSPGPEVSGVPASSEHAPVQVDLSVDPNGMSKATVVMTTSEGVIKFKFYPQDAPGTVNRFAELIQKGFYNGLTFHRVIPGFVVQGGDPTGTGTGGSGQKLKAEFNSRRHTEGAVAMARAADPNSADSQFYISLGTHPHLDRNYTVFGQVIEGMDIARKLKIGDKITSMSIQ